jgi:hypothetical protein
MQGLLLAAAAAFAGAATAGTDLHDMWDGRCKDCHGHAGTFARQTLHIDGGRLAGRHHGADELPRFLRNHYLADEWVEPVMQMLVAQAATAPTFAQRCSNCHGTAAEFARRSLAMKDGQLIGRASGRTVAETLRNHGGLAAADIEPMVRTLIRVLAETGGDKKK